MRNFRACRSFSKRSTRNKDGFITLAEVRRAMDRRVNAAMDAGKTGKRYGLDAGASGAAKAPDSAVKQPKQFSSEAEARRYYQNQYYESLAASKALARERGEPVSKAPEKHHLSTNRSEPGDGEVF